MWLKRFSSFTFQWSHLNRYRGSLLKLWACSLFFCICSDVNFFICSHPAGSAQTSICSPTCMTVGLGFGVKMPTMNHSILASNLPGGLCCIAVSLVSSLLSPSTKGITAQTILTCMDIFTSRTRETAGQQSVFTRLRNVRNVLDRNNF